MPRKRGDCGVFSIGYISVYLGLNRYLRVNPIPCSSSMSSRLLKYETIRFGARLLISVSLSRQEHAVVRHQRGDDDPGDRQRDEHLPAQPHDLVVAITRERRTEPDVRAREEHHLGEQPPPAVDRQQRDAPALERAEPA